MRKFDSFLMNVFQVNQSLYILTFDIFPFLVYNTYNIFYIYYMATKKKPINPPDIDDVIIPGNGDIDELTVNQSYYSVSYQTKLLKDIRQLQKKQSAQVSIVNFLLFLIMAILL